MAPPISVQLYSLRDQMQGGNHVKVIETLGKTGFAGVESAGFYGLKPREFRQLVADHGMVISSNHHFPLPTPENIQQAIDVHKDLGCSFVVSGFWTEDFVDLEAIQRTADKVAWATDQFARVGLTLALHNHWQEFERLGGKVKYDHLVTRCPAVCFEIDTYWAANFGAEIPSEQVSHFRNRTVLLHLKDGSFIRDQPMVACGKGKQDFPAILAAADPAVLAWGVIELDTCASDMLQAVIDSYRYLTEAKLVTGR